MEARRANEPDSAFDQRLSLEPLTLAIIRFARTQYGSEWQAPDVVVFDNVSVPSFNERRAVAPAILFRVLQILEKKRDCRLFDNIHARSFKAQIRAKPVRTSNKFLRDFFFRRITLSDWEYARKLLNQEKSAVARLIDQWVQVASLVLDDLQSGAVKSYKWNESGSAYHVLDLAVWNSISRQCFARCVIGVLNGTQQTTPEEVFIRDSFVAENALASDVLYNFFDSEDAAYRGFSDVMYAMLQVIAQVDYKPWLLDKRTLADVCFGVMEQRNLNDVPGARGLSESMSAILRGTDRRWGKARASLAKSSRLD